MALSQVQMEILERILLKQEGRNEGTAIEPFRVEYFSHRKAIDELVTKNLIKKENDQYFVTLKGVRSLDSRHATTSLLRLNKLISALQSHYRNIFSRESSLLELTKKYVGLDICLYDIHYLSELGIFSQWSYGSDSFSFKMKEEVLEQSPLESALEDSVISPIREIQVQPKVSLKNQERWRLGDGIGGGGQGDVYLATDINDKNSGIKYAYKKLKNKKRIGRFQKEAEAIASLTHKNIVKMVDYSTDEKSDKHFIVYEYCVGGSLENAAPFSTDEAFQIFLDICHGLSEAHSKGIYHRDIKPGNILLRMPRHDAVIADFGLCYIENTDRHTEHHEAVGPRSFMAPELEDGKLDGVTGACDVYSMGKLLYWLLSKGQPIFSREKHREPKYDLRIIHDDQRYEHVNKLLDQMLKPDPSDRWNHARYVLDSTQKVFRLFKYGYHADTPDSGNEICDYCGDDKYSLIADQSESGTDINNLGFRSVSGNRLVIYGCPNCGHTRIFRPDMVKNSSMWKKTSKVLP